MLTLAYGCGLRASEVVRLRACDIDSEQMIIRVVQSKGRKDRNVMLPAEILDLLRQWWKARPTRRDAGVAPEQRWLFPGRMDRQPTTARQFGRLFKEAAKAAGLRKAVSHSFAASFLRNPSARGRQRHSADSGVARNRHILPDNNQSRDGSTIRFILGAAKRCSSSGNSRIAGPIWSSFLSQTER